MYSKYRQIPPVFSSTTLFLLLASSILFSQTTVRVSEPGDGIQPNSQSGRGSISADGGFAVFHSASTNQVPNDWNKSMDVFHRNLRSGRTTRVSVSNAEEQGNRDSYGPRISSNGRQVVFQSEATNLVADDSTDVTDVFLRDMVTRHTSIISTSSEGDSEGNPTEVTVNGVSVTSSPQALLSKVYVSVNSGENAGVAIYMIRKTR
jgi:hypothetical protein